MAAGATKEAATSRATTVPAVVVRVCPVVVCEPPLELAVTPTPKARAAGARSLIGGSSSVRAVLMIYKFLSLNYKQILKNYQYKITRNTKC